VSNKSLPILIVGGLVLLAGAATGISLYWNHLETQKEVDALLAEAEKAQDYIKNPSKAKVRLERVLDLDPDNWNALYLLGRAELGLDQVKQAVMHLEAAVSLAPASTRPAIHLQLGHAYRRRYDGTASDRDFKLSANSFVLASEDQTARPSALHFLGMLWIGKHGATKEDVKKALGYFDQLLSKFPDYPEAASVQEVADLLHAKVDG
jgi:tetratricopeptide (TPR) repeat protein